MIKLCLIDNYDSFTYNIVHYVEEILGTKISVFKNNEITIEELRAFDKIILSPGPKTPSETPLIKEIITEFASTQSILGICLGHQAIAEVFGAKLENTKEVFHGIATEIKILQKTTLFKDIPQKFEGGRYHSWVVSKDSFPSEVLDITAQSTDGYIMAIQHKKYAVSGIQFHPESILTPVGFQLLKNWILA